MIEPMYSVVTMISALTIGSSIYSISAGSGRFAGFVRLHHFSVCLMDFINNARSRCHKIQIVFPLQALLNDLQVKQS